MKRTSGYHKQHIFRETTFNFLSVLKVNKMLLYSMVIICIIATGVLGFTFGGISSGVANTNIAVASESVKLDKEVLEQDLVCLEIEKQDSQKQNDALKEENTKTEAQSATISETILGTLMKNLESKTVANRSANVTNYIAEAKNLIALSNKLAVFKKTADYQLIDLSSYESAIASRLDHIPTLKPVPGDFSGFGWRIHPIYHYRQFHPAADQGAATGTPIKAAAAGYVIRSSYDSSSGNCIVINHGNGFTTVYMHCSVLLVQEGQQVKKGDIIAKVGMTGTATCPHLHFGVSYNGTPFNPQEILMQ